jgi:hypothetical protein
LFSQVRFIGEDGKDLMTDAQGAPVPFVIRSGFNREYLDAAAKKASARDRRRDSLA